MRLTLENAHMGGSGLCNQELAKGVSMRIIDLFGMDATLVDTKGETWHGAVIGRTLSGKDIVMLFGPRQGEVVYAEREEGV